MTKKTSAAYPHPGTKSKFSTWYSKLAAFKVEDLFARKKEPGPKRTVYVNQDLPEEYLDHKGRIKPEHVYATNQVITSKYTIITFVPRNLLEQFRRIANVFFLAIAILQFFDKFSTISPGVVLLPLIVVVGITAIKDGYEDAKRHQSDLRVNHSTIRVLDGGQWVNPNPMQSKKKTFVRGIVKRKVGKKAKAVLQRPGDKPGEGLEGVTTPTMMEDDENGIEYDEVDVQRPSVEVEVLPPAYPPPQTGLHLPHPHLFSHELPSKPHWKRTLWEDVRVGDFVKVMNDEAIPADILICATSEDENVAFVETKNLDGETNLKSRNACGALTHLRSAEHCASKLNKFRVECDRPDVSMYKMNAAVAVEGERFPVDLQTVLLRGTVLRNTGWVIGVVMYTGEDTKIVMNSGGTPSKRSKVERQMNPQVFINLIILAIMAVVCAIVDSVLEHRNFPRGALWLFGDDQPDDNPSINGLVTWAFALITFQNIVPISLYISIEFVRTCQAAFIYFDGDIYYAKTDQATLARSWNLSDDLGQIEYIFSDKTGTLTQNSMAFRQCSIAGKVYSGDPVVEEEEAGEVVRPLIVPRNGVLTKILKDAKDEAVPAPHPPASEEGTSQPPTAAGAPHHDRTAIPDVIHAPGIKLSQNVVSHFRNASLTQDLQDASDVSSEPQPTDPDAAERVARARALNGFFTCLALCHTVLTNVDPATGAMEYKAQSPDEAALVQAAADMGYVFRGRDRDILILQRPCFDANGVEEAEFERYELLNILEFTSARKRMSVVVRKLPKPGRQAGVEQPGEGEGKIFLLTKGADNVIFERLRDGMDELKSVTGRHLDEFAANGLRTLTLAFKVIPEADYQAWSERYHEASISVEDRDEKIDAVSDELERDLRLLGATAIEDRLQDGVPEAIEDLKRAGIKIWVATGDKLETAIAIGHSTNLIGRESNIIVIRGGTVSHDKADVARPIYEQLASAVDQFFPESPLLNHPDVAEALAKAQMDGAAKKRVSSNTHSSRSSGSPSLVGAAPYGGDMGIPLHRVDTGLASVVGAGNGDRPGGFVLVIDGLALTTALMDEKHKFLLLHLAILCEGVICCRVSPLQKALVVNMVKDGLGAMTLAIGDGANDVSMIQAADVGVGISGEEGLQAVNASDYAIAQFRFLKRLLLVHGHWSYARNGTMILNFFYKNIVCIGVLWWFQIYAAWSSTFVFEYTYLLFWNAFWTVAPVIAIGVFDRFIDSQTLMDVPELYHYGREGRWFGIKIFGIYMTDALVQSAIIFFLINYTYFTTSARNDGFQVNLYEFSTTMVFSAVMAANFYNGLDTTAWTAWVWFAVLVGTVLLWVYTAVYNSIKPGWFVTPVYGNNHFLFPSAYFWLALPVTIFLALAPRYLWKAWKQSFEPDDIEILRYIQKTEPNRDIAKEVQEYRQYHQKRSPLVALKRSTSSGSRRTTGTNGDARAATPSVAASRPSLDLRMASRTDMSTGIRSTHRGFDFAMEENGVAMRRIQTNLSEKRLQSSKDLVRDLEPGGSQRRAGKKGLTLLGSIRGKLKKSGDPVPPVPGSGLGPGEDREAGPATGTEVREGS